MPPSVDEDLKDDFKQSTSSIAPSTLSNWDAYRAYEQQQLDLIKILTEIEMLNIDQWIDNLNGTYHDLHYPMSRRIWQTITYLQDAERAWHEQEKPIIKDDWERFCTQVQLHIADRKRVMNLSELNHSLPAVISTTPVERDFHINLPLIESHTSLSSTLSLTMAREIIKSPICFRGAKDDVIEWLEQLDRRFKMANWPDELKLQYISIHLQEDASRWWSQSAIKIKTWLQFSEAIKQAFGSAKLKEITFEQLRTYKQTINQSITQYYDKIIELCKRVDSSMTDSMKLQYLMAGVKPSLKLHIALHDPQSPDAFLSYARKVEDILSLTNAANNSNPDYDTQFDNYSHQSTMLNVRSHHEKKYENNSNFRPQMPPSTSGNSSYFRPKNVSYSSSSKTTAPKRSSNVCYTCGTPGHYSRDCSRSYFH